MKQPQVNPLEKVIKSSGNRLVPVREATFYPFQASLYLREQLQGQSVADAAERLGVKVSDLVRMLDGTWKPTKDVCQKLGLKMVYAISEVAEAGKERTRTHTRDTSVEMPEATALPHEAGGVAQ